MQIAEFDEETADLKAQDQTLTRLAATAAPGESPKRSTRQPSEIALAFDDNRLASIVFGHYDQNIARIERRLGVSANANGNQILIRGPEGARANRRAACSRCSTSAPSSASQPGKATSRASIEETSFQGTLFPGEFDGAARGVRPLKTRRRGVVRARNAAQDRYLAALRKHELVFAEGPAGTGKTWLAVGHAVSLLEQGLVERLVLSRPAVEAGERLGFLPGDMKDKVDPYLRPIYDALYDFMEGRMVERGIQTGMIEIAPLAFMRGRTLSKAAILLDEAQNATAMQMKMFLTRLGEGSRMMVNGDPTQTDLAPGQTSGLSEAIDLLSSLERGRPCAFPPRRRRAARSRAADRRGLREREAQCAGDREGRFVAMSLRVEFVETSRRWRGALPGPRAGARGDRGRAARERRRACGAARRSACISSATRRSAR